MSQNNKLNILHKKYGTSEYFRNIFPKYIKTSRFIENNKKIERIATLKSNIKGIKEEIILVPDYYDRTTHFSNKIFNLNKSASGSFSTVYLQYYNKLNKSKTRKSNIIFKETTDSEGDEYKALIFHYLIQHYYEKNNPEKLKYLCNLREIGKIKYNDSKIYGIMDNCGQELVTLQNSRLLKYDPLKGLLFIVNIFKQSLEALKLLHDLNYLHLDIKPQNYLITSKNQVKIIDFGMIKKCPFTTGGWFGTSLYMPNDWLFNFNIGKQTTLMKHHDIFELGCMFIDLIFYLLNNFTFKKRLTMSCPIVYSPLRIDKVLEYRRKYDINQHLSNTQKISDLLSYGYNKNGEKIKGLQINSNISSIIGNEIIFKMCHPIYTQRAQSVDEIITIVDKLLTYFPNYDVSPDQALRDQALRDQEARYQEAINQVARDKAAHDQAAHEKAARNKAARDQAAREKAARDQAARNKVARVEPVHVQVQLASPIQRLPPKLLKRLENKKKNEGFQLINPGVQVMRASPRRQR